MWGYNEEKEVLGKRITEFWVTEEESKEGHQGLISKGNWIGELKSKRRDGTQFDIQVSSSFVRNKAGKLLCTMGSFLNITENKKVEQALKEREKDLQTKTKSLEEMNTALKVLLKRRDEDRTEIEEKISINVKEFIVPYIEKLKKSRLNSEQLVHMNILESNLNNITSSFARNLFSKYLNLTPREIQIANLVKEGKTSKEIAKLMNVSPGTIEIHRKNMRSKFGTKNKRANLRSYLLSLS